jgi:hypothetical protein
MLCMVNQSHIKVTRNAPRYKLSYPSQLRWGNAIWPKEW